MLETLPWRLILGIWVTCAAFNMFGLGYSISKRPKDWNGDGIALIFVLGLLLAPVITLISLGVSLGTALKE